MSTGPRDRDEEERRARIRVRDKRVVAEGSDAEATEPGTAGAPEASPELAEAHRLAEERLDQLMRLKADFENYRKRVIREQTELVDRASLRVVERLLGVLDDLERAIDAARSHEGAGTIVRGMELVHKRLQDVLASEGLERMESEGAAFDPTEHEAVGSEPGPVQEPTVLAVVRPGYRLKGRTIRPALVNVTTPSEEAAEADPGDEGG